MYLLFHIYLQSFKTNYEGVAHKLPLFDDGKYLMMCDDIVWMNKLAPPEFVHLKNSFLTLTPSSSPPLTTSKRE